MDTPRTPRLLPALTLLLLLAIGADVARRARRTPTAPPARSQRAPATTLAATAPPAADSGARARTRERIREDAGQSYLADMLAEADSMLRRWPDGRRLEPLRLAIVRGSAPGFREDFVGGVVWAVGRWNGVVPVQLATGADSARADIVVTWSGQLDSNRTGRTDLTWSSRGEIRRATVLLATHAPDGRILDAAQMTAVALHEIGHALGLGHSPVESDALYPMTRATQLSERDRRTARLLYELPPGSVRDVSGP